MKNSFIAVLVILVSMVGVRCASAQSEIYYPGSFWTTNGTVSPVEKGNIISLSHFEQGIAKHGVELFVQSTLEIDSKGLNWNRRVVNGIGFRLTQAIGNGVIRTGMSYLSERRFVNPQTINGLSFTVDMWFGWNQHAPINIPNPRR